MLVRRKCSVNVKLAKSLLIRTGGLVLRVSDDREGVVAGEAEGLPHLSHSHPFSEADDRRRHALGDRHESGADGCGPGEDGDAGEAVVDVVESLVEELAHPLGDEGGDNEGDDHSN